MTIGERIKKLRKELNLTQQDFAERIGATQNTMTRYETDKINPSTAAITLICRTFRVNEAWLREGTGPMFVQPTTNEAQIKEWVDGIFEKGSHFEQNFIKAMSHFTDKEWKAMEGFIDIVVAEQKAHEAAAKTAPAPTATTEPPEERPAWMTEEEWASFQRNRQQDPERAALHAELDEALDEKEAAKETSTSAASSKKRA